MNLYGDLPPASGDGQQDESLLAPGGWARPQKAAAKMTPRTLAAASVAPPQSLPSATTAAAAATSEQEAKSTSAAKTTSAMAFMPPSLAAKKIQATQAFKPKQALAKSTQDAPQVPSIYSAPVVTTVVSSRTSAEAENTPHSTESSTEATFEVDDPYDPSQPNDYMQWREDREKLKQQEKEREEMQRILEDQERERQRRAEERQAAVKSGDVSTLRSIGRGAGRGVTNLPAWMTQGADAADAPAPSSARDAEPMQFEDAPQSGGENVAAKLMSRMGYKEGEGLGRGAQGMSEPIQVQALGGSYGRIVPPRNSSADEQQSAPKRRRGGLLSAPSCVLLLKNMVGPGEVDDSLEAETKEECSKYGRVRHCIIAEFRSLPDEEAVRTFVEFEEQESAIRAYKDMNRRFFGGRQIAASFFDEDRFHRRELAPQAGDE